MLAPFQITTLFDMGFGFSFFETSLLINITVIIIKNVVKGNIRIVLNRWTKIFTILFIFIFISVLLAYLKRLIGDLNPLSGYNDISLFIRSLNGSGRLIFYSFGLLIVRSHIKVNEYTLWHAICFSSFLPILALFYQQFVFSAPLSLFANNSTYDMKGIWITYNGIPPMAFTQELTFFCFYTIFSIIASFEILYKRKMKSTWIYPILFFQIFGVLLAASRMGVLAMFIIIFFYMRKQLSIVKSLLIISSILLITFFISNFQQYVSGLGQFTSNYERIFSLVQLVTEQNYSFDASAFDRISSMIAAFNVFLEKGFMLGVGYFNLQFYSARLEFATNHSFVIQLLAEFGLPLFLFLSLTIYYISIKMKSGEKKWLFNLSFYSLSAIPLHAPFTYLLILLPSPKK